MFAILRKNNKFALSLIEVVFVIIMISTGLITLFFTISKGVDYVDYTRKKIIAIEIAKEGMEAVYNIRDTNWTRWSGKKDKCWLKINPLVDDGNDGCENDLWMQGGKNYVLKLALAGNQKYWILSGVSTELNIFDGIDSNDLNFQVCLSGGYWVSCNSSNSGISEGRFFREIKGLELYDKYDDSTLICTNGTDTNCGNSLAKEFRFCSIVQFMGNGKGEVKLCGILTNFMN